MTLKDFGAKAGTFNLYAASPGGVQFRTLTCATPAEVVAHIEAAALCGDWFVLYRAFANEGVTNEQFVTAWIVENLDITPHTAVTIPTRFL